MFHFKRYFYWYRGFRNIHIKFRAESKSCKFHDDDGNKNRDYRVFETLYNRLLSHYGHIPSKRHRCHIIKEKADRSIKPIGSTIISVCLSMFDWAKFRTAKGGLKIHTCWDDTTMISDVVNITPAKLHDRYGLQQLVLQKEP